MEVPSKLPRSFVFHEILSFLPIAWSISMQGLSRSIYVRITSYYGYKIRIPKEFRMTHLRHDLSHAYIVDIVNRKMQVKAIQFEKKKFDAVVFRSYGITINTQKGRTFFMGAMSFFSVATRYRLFSEYCHSTNKMVEKAGMIEWRSYPGCVALENSYIYVVGGYLSFNNLLDTCEKYNIKTDEWTQLKPRLNIPKYNPSLCVFQDKYIYAFGGIRDKFGLSQVERLLISAEDVNEYWEPLCANIFNIMHVSAQIDTNKILILADASINLRKPYAGLVFNVEKNEFEQGQIKMWDLRTFLPVNMKRYGDSVYIISQEEKVRINELDLRGMEWKGKLGEAGNDMQDLLF